MRRSLRRLFEKTQEVDQALVWCKAVSARPSDRQLVEQGEDLYIEDQRAIVSVYGSVCRADHAIVSSLSTGWLQALTHTQIGPDPLGAVVHRRSAEHEAAIASPRD
jgi:hypothetical protein